MRKHCVKVSACNSIGLDRNKFIYPPDLLPEPWRSLFIPIYELHLWLEKGKPGSDIIY